MIEGPIETDQNTDDEIEEAAQEMLDLLLADTDNKFLSEVPQNHERIENAASSQDALEIAQDLILKRLERTYTFVPLYEVEGFSTESVNVVKMSQFLNRVKTENIFVGEGGDAKVVMVENDIQGLPPEICYKIAKSEKIKRGRNSQSDEARIQQEVKLFSESGPTRSIGIPSPLYVVEIGSTKVFAMEKLLARSIEDIKLGIGSVPGWLDIDEFCHELQKFIDYMHDQGLYHRDMHAGNVMIRQSVEKPKDGILGYVIDFGLSGYGHKNMDPYKKESAGEVFTYNNDYDIILIAKTVLGAAKGST